MHLYVVAAILFASLVVFYILICCTENEIDDVKREIHRADRIADKRKDE